MVFSTWFKEPLELLKKSVILEADNNKIQAHDRIHQDGSFQRNDYSHLRDNIDCFPLIDDNGSSDLVVWKETKTLKNS